MNIPSWPKIPLWQPEKPYNLDNTYKLLAALDNPHDKLPKTIHVAGTNGKGSSVAMLASIYQAAGYRVHSYTSPHLRQFNERINLRNTYISDYYLNELLVRVKFAADSLNIDPTFFEGTTVAAFLAFSETPADILIMETGLGGRLDCTNVIKSPLATLITAISYDHMDRLGGTLLNIAKEKAGIIKKGSPCIISMQDNSVYKLLLEHCDKMATPSFCYEYDYGINLTDNGFQYLSQKFNIDFNRPALIGNHQLINAASVIATVLLVNNQIKVTKQQIEQGLQEVKWPGRLEKINNSELPKEISQQIDLDSFNIYIDGAHNISGAGVLSHWMQNNLTEPTYLIVGMTSNRDVAGFCSHFKDIVTEGYGVTVHSESASYSGGVTAKKAAVTGIEFTAKNSLEEAILDIVAKIKKKPANIVIAGSLFLIGDCYNLLDR